QKIERSSFEGVTQQKKAERACHGRHAHSEDRVEQAEPRNHRVVFDDQYFREDEQLHQNQDENRVPPREPQLRKSVARQGAEDELADQDDADKEKSVPEILQPRRTVPGGLEVLQGPRTEEVEVHGIRGGMEGSPEGKNER